MGMVGHYIDLESDGDGIGDAEENTLEQTHSILIQMGMEL